MEKVDITVRGLVDKVKRWELALPEMQRKYVRPSSRVRDLIDSLYRWYPSGTILVRATDEFGNERELAVRPTEEQTNQKQLLLDGQQRITSLSAVINWEPIIVKYRRKPIDILFNLDHPEWTLSEVIEDDETDIPEDFEELEDEETAKYDIQEEFKKRTFVVATKTLKNNPSRISVSDVFRKTEKELLKPKGINSDDDIWDFYSARIQKLKWIQEYPYVMQVLDKSMSYEEVTEIFVRVNSLGIKLRWSDLALAQITSKWKGFMNEVEIFSKEFWNDADYIVDTNITIRLLVILITHQSKFQTVSKINKETFQKHRPAVMDWLRFVVDFLRNNAQINDLGYLSSPFLLLPLAVYAINNKEKLSSENERKLLKRFFLAHMRGHYGMWSSEWLLDADVSILFKTNSVDELINQLKLHVKKFIVDSEDIAYKSIRSPLFSMLYFVLKANGAKDRKTWLGLSDKNIWKSHKIQFHHIFPKSLMKDKYDQKEINEIANLAFISWGTNKSISNKEPIVYFQDIIKKRKMEALDSQLIPSQKELWKLDSYKSFIEFRRNEIATKINEFMENIESGKKMSNEMDIEELIEEWETEKIEFKSSIRWDLIRNEINKELEIKVMKETCAFLNTNWGILLIGIDDNSNILGLENDYKTLWKKQNKDWFVLKFTELINNFLWKEFHQFISVSIKNIDDKDIAVIKISLSDRPCFVNNNNKEEFYIRAGTSAEPMSISEANKYIQSHWKN